ncbi:hypothetical protein ESZ53_06130 [Salinibacterium sp. UTAS2018]|uniref:hypothetical protein n=1 Tax=Salinibacterium sp. UTAS2018 TaxID=2508880 RepID=UPI0010097B57|nr:hypothetical protein [Salinibacterium sp. UTAS2018]QAV70050.1 hypothetical protein ESZ53_06130 [Salinibacterium sp. UTAS2018]
MALFTARGAFLDGGRHFSCQFAEFDRLFERAVMNLRFAIVCRPVTQHGVDCFDGNECPDGTSKLSRHDARFPPPIIGRNGYPFQELRSGTFGQ